MRVVIHHTSRNELLSVSLLSRKRNQLAKKTHTRIRLCWVTSPQMPAKLLRPRKVSLGERREFSQSEHITYSPKNTHIHARHKGTDAYDHANVMSLHECTLHSLSFPSLSLSLSVPPPHPLSVFLSVFPSHSSGWLV